MQVRVRISARMIEVFSERIRPSHAVWMAPVKVGQFPLQRLIRIGHVQRPVHVELGFGVSSGKPESGDREPAWWLIGNHRARSRHPHILVGRVRQWYM